MPKEIELTEVSPGKWEVTQRLANGDHLPSDPAPEDEPAKKPEEPWEHTVDNIPTVGTPVEFFAMIFLAWLASYLLQ